MCLCWLCLKSKINIANSINLDYMAAYILNDHIMISTFLMFLRRSIQKFFSASIFKHHRKLGVCVVICLLPPGKIRLTLSPLESYSTLNFFFFPTSLMYTKYLHQKCQEKKKGAIKHNHMIFEGLLTSLTFPSLWLETFCSFWLILPFILFSFLFSFLWV